jgi:hypothetical protein
MQAHRLQYFDIGDSGDSGDSERESERERERERDSGLVVILIDARQPASLSQACIFRLAI